MTGIMTYIFHNFSSDHLQYITEYQYLCFLKKATCLCCTSEFSGLLKYVNISHYAINNNLHPFVKNILPGMHIKN